MRRSEFASDDMTEFEYIVQHGIIGHLGLVDRNNYARIIPLNFGVIGTDIYFHGATEGEKYDLMQYRDKASFSIEVPYSFIPSYFSSDKSAVPTSHFFKSVHMRGRVDIIEDLMEKAKGFMSMMNKYQPEGGYVEINPKVNFYRKPLTDVGVFRFVPNEITMKIKFGQNASQPQIERIISYLRKRGTDLDFQTVGEIIKRSPYDLSHLLLTNSSKN